MAQGFYTLEEAAGILGIQPDDLNRMAQKREVRAFADGGSWRFRTQDIDEMRAKQGGAGGASTPSKLDMLAKLREPGQSASQLKSSKVAQAKPGSKVSKVQSGVKPQSQVQSSKVSKLPAPSSKVSKLPTPMPAAGSKVDPPADPEVFGFSLGPENSKVEIGQEMPVPMSSGGSGSKPKTTSPPMSSGDSAARLVGSGDLDLGDPASIPLIPDEPGLAPTDELAASSPPTTDAKKTNIAALRPETGLRVGPLDEDNDVQLGDIDLSATDDDLVAIGENLPQSKVDSDVRLDSIAQPRGVDPEGPGMPQTEEMIDLDSVAAAEAGLAPLTDDADSDLMEPGSSLDEPSSDLAGSDEMMEPPSEDDGSSDLRPTSEVQLPDLPPENSPFELSENDLSVPPDAGDSAGSSAEGSDFELSLNPEEGGGEVQLEMKEDTGDSEEVELGALPPMTGDGAGLSRAGQSGINLQNPADSGVSLDSDMEATTDDVSYELGASAGPKTGDVEAGTDSEFELTVDEDGGLAAAGEEPAAAGGEEKDIFETDFDLPALDDESASEAVQLEESETDLGSSDFDLAVDDASSELSVVEDESGSEVVALDEEGASSLPQTRLGMSDDDASHFDELLTEDDIAAVDSSLLDSSFDTDAVDTSAEVVSEEPGVEELEPAGAAAGTRVPATAVESAPPAEWGVLPVALLVPCVLIMLLAGLMSYELLHGMWGYQQPYQPSGLVVRSIAGMFE